MGLKVWPHHINLSDWSYTVKGQTLRVGSMQVQSLSREFVERILTEQTTGDPFQSFQDFLRRMSYESA
jgi:DNA polymerase III alpha subunit